VRLHQSAQQRLDVKLADDNAEQACADEQPDRPTGEELTDPRHVGSAVVRAGTRRSRYLRATASQPKRSMRVRAAELIAAQSCGSAVRRPMREYRLIAGLYEQSAVTDNLMQPVPSGGDDRKTRSHRQQRNREIFGRGVHEDRDVRGDPQLLRTVVEPALEVLLGFACTGHRSSPLAGPSPTMHDERVCAVAECLRRC
jgi:hypothetical protein